MPEIPPRVNLAERFAALPPEWPDDMEAAIRDALGTAGRKVVVLDDDPTGTQTVQDVAVLTEWSVSALAAELKNASPVFYVLTNSRSLPLGEARALHQEIGRNLVEAGRQAGQSFVVISRSDSTLRGHFPSEVEALAQALEQNFDAFVIIPFFEAGGRYTLDDIHYVAEGEWLVPAGETEFARDATFGYAASNLRQWVEEKTEGRIQAEDVAAISLTDIRCGGPDVVTERLATLQNHVCIVNAVSPRDLEVVTLGLLRAEAQGRQFLYRTAASFVPVRAGLSSRPLLTGAGLTLPGNGGGLIVVGSYVQKTTDQVAALQAQARIATVEVSVEALLSGGRQDAVEQATAQVDNFLTNGEDVILLTSRRLITGDNPEQSLLLGQEVSQSLVEIIRGLSRWPRYVLAKGGITSSDVATKALGVRRALVRGQILPGIPVWQLGPESRFPGLIYVVFPGNVGSPTTLADLIKEFRPSPA